VSSSPAIFEGVEALEEDGDDDDAASSDEAMFRGISANKLKGFQSWEMLRDSTSQRTRIDQSPATSVGV
jgi:hypothetical protein